SPATSPTQYLSCTGPTRDFCFRLKARLLLFAQSRSLGYPGGRVTSSDGPFYSASVLHLLAKPLDLALHLSQLGALPSILGTQPPERLALAPERCRGRRRRPEPS